MSDLIGSETQEIEIETVADNIAKLPNEKTLKQFVYEFLKTVGLPDQTPDDKTLNRLMSKLRNKYKVNATKSQMRYIYDKYLHHDFPRLNHTVGRFLIKKSMRSRSGVLVSTITLKPDAFSCPRKCSYCPTESDLTGKLTQPKSYLSSEPAMLRALQYDFDVKEQLWDRVRSYIKTGNILTHDTASEITHSYKLEMILSGGTWESYKLDYRNQVMHEIYYAANTFGTGNARDMLPFDEEVKINETAKFRIIGMTIETRPDYITNKSIRDYRIWGVTRVQIGVQHYDDTILDKINRECYTKDTIRAIKLLKQTGFKVVCHLMPDLPGSSPELDNWMFQQAITIPDLQFDDVKIYPTAVCKSHSENLIVKSDILDWYESGEYKPYAESNLRSLIEVLKNYKKNIQPWVRIQRLVRDIPATSIAAGYEKKSNLRQIIQDEMKAEGTRCKCIRCMEVGNQHNLMDTAQLVVRSFEASNGLEYFISIESNHASPIWSGNFWEYVWFIISYWIALLVFRKTIYWSGNLETYNGLIGFCRLRIDAAAGADIIPEIKNSALIREVHVYGYSLGVGSVTEPLKSSQHKGYGKLLVKTAEEIAVNYYKFKKVSVIAGVGTREYYKNKCGYELEGTYMVKYF